MDKITAIAILLLGTACGASRPHVELIKAEATTDDEPRVAVAARTLTVGQAAQDDQLRPRPPADEPATRTATTSYDVIDRANQAAAQGPEAAAYFNAIQEYAFVPGTLYQLYTAPMRVTDITLEAGERIIGQPASGDIVRWVLAIGKSLENGIEQQHLYLKPTRPGLQTNLVLNTNKRSYFLELHSYEKTYMASVKWRYPQDEVERLATDAAEAAALRRNGAPVTSVENLNFGYRIKVIDGDPNWTPTQVFDDGRKTFIRFPGAMLAREAPVLFVMRKKETQLVNYRVKRDIYVVDRLIDVAELRLGQRDQEIVRIEREGR
jgi:P-type conjugative transfer protein TrbG